MGCNNSSDNDVHDASMVKLEHMIHSRHNRRATATPLNLEHADVCSDTEPMLLKKKPSSFNPEYLRLSLISETGKSFDDELMNFVKEVFRTYDKDSSGFLEVE